MSRRCPYEILGVSAEATAAEIKCAYRKLARQCHPDSTGGDKAKEARFKEISTAYDLVGDPEQRARFDSFDNEGFGVEGLGLDDLFQMFAGATAGGRDARNSDPSFSYRVFTGGGANPDLSDLGDLFGGFARPNGRASARAPAIDTHSELRIAIDEAILGTLKEVATPTGTVTVKVPPGTSSGVKLRLRGKGSPAGDGQRGSHYVTVQIDVPKQLDDEGKQLLAQLMKKVAR